MPACLACRIVEGETVVPGGLVVRDEHFTVHGLADPSPLPGWVVVTSNRHVRAIYDLDDVEAAALGTLVVKVMRAQREVLGAEHVYALALGDVLQHAHVHLVPRYAGTPPELRGRQAFDAVGKVAAPMEQLEAATEVLRRALGGEGADGRAG